MAGPVVGLLHPGAMGAAVGAALRGRGIEVLWASEGRSPETATRAAAAGLRDAGTVREVADAATVLLSVCPPHAALDGARAAVPFAGVYVDANAVSPATARDVAALVERAGGAFVDGGIVGAPPAPGDPTRLYLSGARAAEVAALFAGTPVDARVVGARPGAASALKLAYAAWSKGTAALLLAIRATARAEGVEEALLAEWALSVPELERRSRQAARAADAKGWRWEGEMREIATAFGAAGQPEGFHRAAAEVFGRLGRPADDGAGDVLESVLARLGGPAR